MRERTAIGSSNTSNPSHGGHPRRGRHEPCEDTHGGGLARTVWTNEANDLTRANLKAHPVHRRDGAEVLAEILSDNH